MDEHGETNEGFTDPRYEYEPTMFLKCHSKIKGDRNDRITKVWACAFEPHPDYPEESTDLVATCGANSVCVINVKTEHIITKHYSKHSTEDFFTVAWGSVLMELESGKKRKSNILAVAGLQCVLHLLHPCKNICILEETIRKPSSRVSLNSLQFHPFMTKVLCGAFSDGEVHVWDLGVPCLPDYNVKLTELHVLNIENEIFNTSFSRVCSCLLASTDDGVVGWAIESTRLHDSNSKIKMWRFNFPVAEASGCQSRSQDTQLVDSTEPIINGKIVASKCVLYGNIYLWDLEEAIENYPKRGKNSIVQPLHTLQYSNTDNYFMNMGSSLLSGLLACGDDIGNIWLYDLNQVLSQESPPDLQEQAAVIPWPQVHEKCDRMIRQKEIVVNKVIVDAKGIYLVAVTSTNLVCVWKKEQV